MPVKKRLFMRRIQTRPHFEFLGGLRCGDLPKGPSGRIRQSGPVLNSALVNQWHTSGSPYKYVSATLAHAQDISGDWDVIYELASNVHQVVGGRSEPPP
jgi:hypothetical protein